jgi:cytochrome oxidase Cu insertion factor (SCO1/SenC/PrrC family)
MMKTGHAAARRRRDRRTLIVATSLVALLLVATGGYLSLIGAADGPRGAMIGGPFELTSSDGQPVTDGSFRGKYLLIYFGYTSCEDVCPTTLAGVAEALDALGHRADRLQPLFITLDPVRDTPRMVGRFAASFTPRLIGLTGTPEALRKVAREYRVNAVPHSHAETEAYRIDHSSVLYLVGPDGRYLAPVRANQTGALMAQDLARYLS